MRNVDVTVVLLHQDVLSKLISVQEVSHHILVICVQQKFDLPVDERVVELECKNEFPQAISDCDARYVCTSYAGSKDAQCIGSASVHLYI